MSKKHVIVILAILLLSIILFTITKKVDNSNLISTIFTINGIMFSIGLGLISSFNLHGIKNRKYLKTIRDNINSVRNSFIFLFGVSSLSYIVSILIPKPIFIYDVKIFHAYLDPMLFSVLLMVYTIFYFIINFIEIQSLNNQIIDRINIESELNKD